MTVKPRFDAPSSVCTRESYVAKIDKGLRSNYLVALQLIIERDPAIPSAPPTRAELQDRLYQNSY